MSVCDDLSSAGSIEKLIRSSRHAGVSEIDCVATL